MSSYYGVTRSSEYLAHYGVRGMKWGVRKAIQTGDSNQLGKHYYKAAQKLQKLRAHGKHSRANNFQKEMDTAFRGTIYDANEQNKLSQNAIGNKRSKALYNKALKAQVQAYKAKGAYNAHAFDFGGSRRKAYQEANAAAQNAHQAYYNSLKKRQKNRYMRRIEVLG